MMDNHSFSEEMIDNISNQSLKQSFTFSCLSDDCVAYDADDHTDKFEHNQDQYEHELFFDMDITLPFTWGDPPNPPRNCHHIDPLGASRGNSNCLQDTQEFEFSITFSDHGPGSSGGFIGALSPADDLFYKGQLLPLHLRPRLRMVERLSCLESKAAGGGGGEEDYEHFNANGSSEGFTQSILELIDKEKYTFSCQGSLVEEVYRLKKPCSSMGSSSGAWMDMKKVQDAGVFPDCYKDPALQMLQVDVNCAGAKGYSRPSSIGWRVFLPGSRRLSCHKLELLQETFPACDNLRKAKEAHKWGFSIVKLRASASLFKSLLHAGELGRLLVHPKGHHRHYRGTKDDIEVEEEVEGHLPSFSNCSEFVTCGIDKQPLQTANSQAERDKIIKKAKIYLQKYVKLFKSMYVSISHINHEQTRNLLESSSMEEMSIKCRSSSCKTREHIANMEPKASRTTSFSKRPKRTGDSIVDCLHHSSRLCDEGAGCSSVAGGSSRLEVENPIQGAIAHCKQSSSLSS